jgi:hypothetical protein
VPPLPYSEIVKMMEETSEAYNRRGEYAVREVLSAPKVLSFTTPETFVLVKVSEISAANSESYVEIVGGGADGARPEPKLFRHLVTRTLAFDWGGPFANHFPSGTVTFGHRMLTPSDLIVSENIRNCIGYIYGMIDVIGQTARVIASEIIPEVGGRLLDGSGRDDTILLTALMAGGAGANAT